MANSIAKLVALITPKRRWAQFSLLTLFLVVTVLCVSLSIVVNRAHRQRDAVAAIDALGGGVEYVKPDQSATEAFPKRLLRRWLPRDYFDEVRLVDLSGTHLTDTGLAHLHGLTGLQELSLNGTQVTDAGLAQLHGLTGLQGVSLYDTQVTDGGLVHLQVLTGLRVVDLRGSQVTDTGLPHLHGLTRLTALFLPDTQVTDDGIAEFQRALPNCDIVR